MNLERVEELCLNYLRQAPAPVVPVEMLLHHCQRDEGLEKLGREQLLEFLRRHQEITVLDSLSEQSGLDSVFLEEMALDLGPRAVLNSRIPSRKEMLVMLVQQLDHIQLSLNAALSQAQNAGDTERAGDVRLALQRAQSLREQFEGLM